MAFQHNINSINTHGNIEYLKHVVANEADEQKYHHSIHIDAIYGNINLWRAVYILQSKFLFNSYLLQCLWW